MLVEFCSAICQVLRAFWPPLSTIWYSRCWGGVWFVCPLPHCLPSLPLGCSRSTPPPCSLVLYSAPSCPCVVWRDTVSSLCIGRRWGFTHSVLQQPRWPRWFTHHCHHCELFCTCYNPPPLLETSTALYWKVQKHKFCTLPCSKGTSPFPVLQGTPQYFSIFTSRAPSSLCLFPGARWPTNKLMAVQCYYLEYVQVSILGTAK